MRCRIEHAEMITKKQMERAGDLSMYSASNRPMKDDGAARADFMNRGWAASHNKSSAGAFDRDIVVCGGSDSDVTDLNPLTGIHWAVNHPVEEHRLRWRKL